MGRMQMKMKYVREKGSWRNIFWAKREEVL
jgi:hypothetical protein